MDALRITVGMAHTEIIYTKDQGPVLIEMNGRWHLTNFGPLVDRCVGYNAVDAMVDVYTDPAAFEALPSEPERLRESGRVVHLVSYVSGKLKRIHHMEQISALESVQDIHFFPKFVVGEDIPATVDISTDAGYVHLIHSDPDVVESDYQTIVDLMPTMLEVEA